MRALPLLLVLFLSLPQTSFARRASDFLSSSSSSSARSASSAQTSSKSIFSSHRQLWNQARQDWKDREEGKRSSSSSSSSVQQGTYKLEPLNAKAIIGKKRALLFFCTNWNLTCQRLEKELKSWGETKPFIIPLQYANYDEETDLRKTYSVRYTNTYILIDEKGNKIERLENPHPSKVQLLLYGE